MQFSSPVFTDGQYLPADYTSEGSGESPALFWSDAPTGTRSFALVVTDNDIPSPKMRLGKFIHWIVYNLPVEQTTLSSNFTEQKSNEIGAVTAPNGAGIRGYYPPCPVSGIHAYVFKLYALDVPKIHPVRETSDGILKEISLHTLDSCELVGLYQCTTFTRWQALMWNCRVKQFFLI